MSPRSIVQKSKKLSWLLRHGAPSVGLPMDAAGWAPIVDVMRFTALTRADLDEVVRDNTKARFEVDGDRIRATQGHSIAGGAVSIDALEASWDRYEGAGPLWHGTHADAVVGIARDGIQPVSRTHVHLAASTDSHVGKRANVSVLLEVSAPRLRDAGLAIFRSPNGVLLTRHVPVPCIVGLTAATAAGRQRAPALRGLLGLDRAAERT